jgi:hypothetical protein
MYTGGPKIRLGYFAARSMHMGELTMSSFLIWNRIKIAASLAFPRLWPLEAERRIARPEDADEVLESKKYLEITFHPGEGVWHSFIRNNTKCHPRRHM